MTMQADHHAASLAVLVYILVLVLVREITI